MINILIHGLGQNKTSWNEVEKELANRGIKTENPDLYLMLKNNKADYHTLLNRFTDYCNGNDDKLNLCGISLGGVLALDYAKRFPDKVNSLVLIGTPYEIPEFLFRIQSVVFRLTPKSFFEKLGCPKRNFVSLVNSMGKLNIAAELDKINCKALILCGEKDGQNIESGEKLNENIKGSSFHIVEHSSHEVNADNPKELSNIIYAFWQLSN